MKKEITAAELIAQLNADPEYVARKARQEAIRQQRETENRKDEAVVVQELRAVGINVDSTATLVSTSAPYPAALPILLKHLQEPHRADVRETIARAMGVPEAKFAWETLVRLFNNEQEKGPKDGLAVALGIIADDELLGDLIELAKNRKHGSSRLLLLSGLKRSKDPRAEAALRELQDDPDLYKEVALILKNKKKPKLWPK